LDDWAKATGASNVADEHQGPTATEPKPEPASAAETPAIENELPAYRAIHPLAIVALVLGGLSALSFADLGFLAAAGAAVVVGLIADWKIRRLSDVLTGQGLARAGIAMGVVFGLSSVTLWTVNGFLLQREAARFARQYVADVFPPAAAGGTGDAAQASSIATAVWYQLPPPNRRGLSPNGAIEMLRRAGADTLETQTRGVRSIQARLLADPANQRVEYVKLEWTGYDGIKPEAWALLRVAAPPLEKFPEAQEFALLVLQGDRQGGGRINWFVEAVVYPYKPASYVPKPAPVDDGHGHGH
jgi:hypothetical protein